MNEEWRDELVTKGAVVDALKDNMFRLTLAEEQRCEGHVVWDEDVVFADVLEKALLALPPAQPQDIARDIATIIENEKDMRVILKNAQPQRMRGEWIEDGYNHYKAVCSECGEPCATYVMGKPRDKFCKWCGADMRGEQDG